LLIYINNTTKYNIAIAKEPAFAVPVTYHSFPYLSKTCQHNELQYLRMARHFMFRLGSRKRAARLLCLDASVESKP
jgi:hypothetical protein